MMGSGKSTIGSILAQRLGWPFHDNDVMLRQLFAATPRELLAAGGEAAMHSAEVTALRAALDMPAPAVVAAAGGTILDPELRSELSEAGLIVWLRVAGETVQRRSAGGAHRPWPDDDRAGWIAQAVEARERLYDEVADLVLDTDALAPETLAGRIVEELGRDPAADGVARRP